MKRKHKQRETRPHKCSKKQSEVIKAFQETITHQWLDITVYMFQLALIYRYRTVIVSALWIIAGFPINYPVNHHTLRDEDFFK